MNFKNATIHYKYNLKKLVFFLQIGHNFKCLQHDS